MNLEPLPDFVHTHHSILYIATNATREDFEAWKEFALNKLKSKDQRMIVVNDYFMPEYLAQGFTKFIFINKYLVQSATEYHLVTAEVFEQFINECETIIPIAFAGELKTKMQAFESDLTILLTKLIPIAKERGLQLPEALDLPIDIKKYLEITQNILEVEFFGKLKPFSDGENQ